MKEQTEQFNYLVLVFSAALILSVFARFSNNVIGIQAAVFFVIAAAFLFEFNFFSVRSPKALLPILLFAVAVIVSYYMSDFKHNARNGVILASYCGGAYLLSGFLNENEKRGVLMISVFISLWLTIYLLATNVAFGNLLEPAAISRNAMSAASFLLMALAISFIFWWGDRPAYRYMSFVIFVAILITKSYLAVALASLAFAIFMFSVRSRIKVRTYITVTPFLLIAFAALYILFFRSPYLADKMASWHTALAVFKNNMLFGVGFTNYENASLYYASVSSANITFPENMFLQILAETGLFGAVTFCAVVALFFYRAASALKEPSGKDLFLPLMLGVSAFMIFNFFESFSFVATNMLMFFIMLAVPLGQYQSEPRKRKANSYVLIVLTIPLLISLGMPVYAQQEFRKGIMFFGAGRYSRALDFYTTAFRYDFMNPEYASKIADAYFAMYRETDNSVYLHLSFEYAKRAVELNRRDSRYYYQLAWLYHFMGEKQLASESIVKALELNKFDEHVKEAYGTLLY